MTPRRHGDDRRRVGIVGTGFIGEVHARAARRHGAVVAAVVAGSPASTAAAVDRLGAERGERDAAALIAAEDIDVVHICTPNDLHVPLAVAAAEAGKPVVCEKPLATDPAGADAVVRAVRASGVVATVPFVYRFYPMVREARARLRSGGSVRLIHGAYLQDWLADPRDQNWRVDAAQAGGSRAFADIGSHWCDLVEFVTGDRLAAVSAELVTVFDERSVPSSAHTFRGAADGDQAGAGSTVAVDTEDVALVQFRTIAGVHGALVVSQISTGRKNQLRFEITAADGTFVFDQEHPDQLWIGGRSSSQLLARDPAHLDPGAAAYVTVPPGHPQGYQDCFDAFVADTYRAIDGADIDGLPTVDDGRRAVVLTDAVRRSAARHGWIDVEPAGGVDTREVDTHAVDTHEEVSCSSAS